MKSRLALMVGCGDLGTRIGQSLLARGWSVAGVRRRQGALPPGFTEYVADYTRPGSLAFLAGIQPDYVVATFNPADPSEAGYRAGFAGGMTNLLAGLGEHRPRHVIAVTSTRVYAERDGGWVEEDSPLSTTDSRALAMIEAERRLLDSVHNASVVRLAGIYGAPEGRLLARVKRGAICPAEPLRYTNRIHREDCAGFITHLLMLAEAGERLAPVYIGVDDRPAPRFEVETWLAQQLGVIDRHTGSAPVSDRQDTAGHKRCRNVALHQSGYSLRYPDYKRGYGALFEDR